MFSGRRKMFEIGKDVLIAALIVSALLLARQTGLFGSGGSDGSILQSHDVPTENGSVAAAAIPYYIAAVPESGGRYGLTHGEERVTEMYNRFSAILGEALGSSGQPEQVEEARWREALTKPGVYFDYLYPQSLSVLSGWLGTEISGSAAAHAARRICLALEEDSLMLYYIRADNGEFCRCETALSASMLSSRMEEYMPNGAQFCFELTEDAAIDAYALMEDGIQSFNSLSGTNPLRDAGAAERLTDLFGFSGSVRSYSETDGIVYVEGDATLRVSSSGTVTYRCQEGGVELGGASASVQTVVEEARKFCISGPGSVCGAARLGLSGLRFEQAGNTCVLTFEYASNGVPVRLTDGAAVELTVQNGTLREAVVHYRSYSAEAETVSPLPQTLALAAVRAVGGGEPLLTYVDTRKEVTLQWIAA